MDKSQFVTEIEPNKDFNEFIDLARSWVKLDGPVDRNKAGIGFSDNESVNRPTVKEKSIGFTRPAWLIAEREINRIFNFKIKTIGILITHGGQQMAGYHHEGTQYLEHTHPRIQKRFNQLRRNAALNFSLLTSESHTSSSVRWALMPDYIEEEYKNMLSNLKKLPSMNEEIYGDHSIRFACTDTICSDPSVGTPIAEHVGMEKPVIFNARQWHTASNLDSPDSSPRLILTVGIDETLLYEDVIEMYHSGRLYR